MKRIKLIIIFMISMIPISVNAASSSITLDCPNTLNIEEGFTCSLKGSSGDGSIEGFESTIILSDGVTCSEIDSNYFDASMSNKIALILKNNPMTSGNVMAVITCSIGSDYENQTISLTDNKMPIRIANGDTAKSSPANVTENIHVRTNNTNLATLSVSGISLSPSFDASTTSYTAITDASSITISATAVDGVVSGTGTKTLSYGLNTFKVIVTSEIGSTKTYTLNITRNDNRNSDSSLKSLTVENTSINFNASTKTYNVTLASNISTFKVNGVVNNSKSSISYSPSQSISIGYGETKSIKITVKAENTSVTTYIITAYRKDDRSTNNKLKSLTVSNTDIKFNGNTSYTKTVENDITSVEIKATVDDTKSSLTGTGIKSLEIGNNTFRIVVKAENNTEKVYTITIIRKSKDNDLNLSEVNTLKSLEIEGVTFEFKKDTLKYDLVVENIIDDIKINYVLEDSKASAVVEGETKLKIGNNTIKILVTSESGDTQAYILNITRKEERLVIKNNIEDILKEIESNNIEDIYINIDSKEENKKISKDVLEKIKGKNRNIIYEITENSNILLSLKISGTNIDNTDEIDLSYSNSSSNQELINSLNDTSTIINFNNKISLPKDTVIKIYLNNKYKNNSILSLYSVNNNKIEEVNTNIKVENSYVELSINELKEYVLIENNNKEVKNNLLPVILGLVAGIIVVAILVIILKKKKIL